MKELAEFPFDKYKFSKYWHKTEERWYVNLLPTEGRVAGNVKTMTLARYRMQIMLKRTLTADEHVDHINNNKSDDSFENLQILTRDENSAKHREFKNIVSKQIELVCPVCDKTFSRRLTAVTHLLKKGKVLTCSHKCGYVKQSQTRKQK